ncbi:beta sliding clamp [Ralstonia phage Darius]|uniref:Beta sliding clamp n=2 Tax=Gervaisevirus gervaise TaxID=2846047 RepID=A0A7G5BAF5_9CAUD|nr:DNA polymerase processivity factor [Ralstonia phage Gervaise]QMV32762.1 beta sliding clamp [Ralstonia phage Darius]QMV33278.1 beta sliding clamp [Ralstonia phage Gervaise]
MISFDTKDFERALSTVSRVIQRSPIPVLGMVRVQADERGARLIGTNTEAQITAEIEPQGKKLDIDVCIPLDRLNAAMKVAGPTITIKAANGKANIKTGSSNINPPAQPGADMPLMDIEGGAVVEFQSDWLAGAMERVDSFTGVNDLRTYLNGVFIESTGDELVAVATNGHALAMVRTPANIPEFSAIVPEAHVGMLSKLGPATYTVYENRIAACADGVEIVTKLVSCRYVDYRRVVHNGGGNAVTLDRSLLLSAASVAGGFSARANPKLMPSIRVFGRDDSIVVSNLGDDEFEMAVPAINPKGIRLDAGVNSAYLSNTLKQLSGETVTLQWQDGLSSFLITEDEFTAIIMPVRV